MRLPSELVALAVIVAVALGSAVVVSAFSAKPHFESVLPTLAPPTPVRSPTPVPSILPGPLNGEPTPRDRALRRPVAVVVDNFYPDARPQSGLSQASTVYETLTEGGITRLMALYLEHDAATVGPVRSARPYFIQWADEYGAIFVHAGGSPGALNALQSDRSVIDVDALQSDQAGFRLSGHAAPHDLFTDTAAVRKIAAAAHQRTFSGLSEIPHKAPAPLSARGNAGMVSIDFSTSSTASPPEYVVTYRYDRNRNLYLRSVGNVPDVDPTTKTRLVAANVVILTAVVKPIPNDEAGRVTVQAIGRGPATILRDGTVIRGTWTHPGAAAPLTLTSSGGRTVRLDPGVTWFEVAPRGAVRFGK